MQGTVLRDHSGHPYESARRFLTQWVQDTNFAFQHNTFDSGDREPYPGHEMAAVVEDGYIDKDEFNNAAIEFLAGLNDADLRYHLEAIATAAILLMLDGVQNWFADHFDRLYEVCRDERGIRDLVQVAALAPNGAAKQSLKKLMLQEPRWGKDPATFVRVFRRDDAGEDEIKSFQARVAEIYGQEVIEDIRAYEAWRKEVIKEVSE